MVSSDNLDFLDKIFWPEYINVSKITPDEIKLPSGDFRTSYYADSPSGDYKLEYGTIAQALADGWELTSAPVQIGTSPDHLYYTWVLVKK